ncbi:TIGR04388 family protein [Leptospira interrogans]|uniref:TIGR04388 family protein n=1 Tax=Leptospira interrogans TaxID=173 RepID=UPI003CE74043
MAGSKALPVGEAMQAFAAAMKMSNLSLGFSYNRDAGLGMNVNANFTNKLGLGLDYNFKSGDYTANASYDFDKVGGKDWANASLGISASKNGHASASVSYNTDGNTAIPQALRGSGATLDFGNDGLIGLSVQAMRGATVGTLTYDTNTHGFQPLTLNNNYQNEFNQGQAAENAAYNHQKGQMEILMKELSLGTKMDKPLFTQAEIDAALPKDEHGNLDMEKANPEKLLDKWNAHKEARSKTPEGLQKWKDEVSKAGERSGIEVKFNDGKSATSTFGKFVTGLMGDVAQSFGFANDGSKMIDKAGVFHLDTCFVAGTQVHTKDGMKSIESLQIGDIVQSWNEKTGQVENKPVTELFVHEVPQLFYLELDGEEVFQTTWNHPFRRRIKDSLIQNSRPLLQILSSSEREFENQNISELTQTSEWVQVADLKIRDQVLKSDGSWARVTGIFHYNVEPTKVYNIEVEDNHTYIVGENVPAVVHNYTEQVQRILDGVGILSEDNSKMFGGVVDVTTGKKTRAANAEDKIRALGKVNEFDHAGSKWKNIGTDEKGVVHFQSESNKYGLKEDLYFRNNKGQVEIEQVQHLNGKEYPTKHTNLDVLKQVVVGVNFKTTGEYLNHLTNVLGERGGSGTKYDINGTPKVSLVKDVNGQAILHETKNGTHTAEIERNGYKGKMLVEEVGRTQREARSDYSGERGLVRAYDKSNPNEYKAWDWQNDKYGDGKGGDLRDSAVCQSTVIAEDRHNNGKTVGEVAKVMGDFAVALGKRPSQLSIKEISQALKESGLTIRENHRIEIEPNETRAHYNDRFFNFAKRQLDQGMAVNVGGKYAASIGHVTRITGYVEGPHGERGFMINDSYGDANKGYGSKAGGQDGRAVFYPIDKLKIAELNYGYSITEDTGTNTPSGSGSSNPRRRNSSSGGFWNKFSNIFKFDFFKRN